MLPIFMPFSCFPPCLPRYHLNFDILHLTCGFPNISTIVVTLYAFLYRLMEVKISTEPFERKGLYTRADNIDLAWEKTGKGLR